MNKGQKANHIKVLCIALTALLIVSIMTININFNQQVFAFDSNLIASTMTNQTESMDESMTSANTTEIMSNQSQALTPSHAELLHDTLDTKMSGKVGNKGQGGNAGNAGNAGGGAGLTAGLLAGILDNKTSGGAGILDNKTSGGAGKVESGSYGGGAG